MSQTAVNYIGIISGLCSIAALALYFITVPKQHKFVSILVTIILIGIPLAIFLSQGNVHILLLATIICSTILIFLSYYFGKTRAEKNTLLPDIIAINNERTDGYNWIVEKVKNVKSGAIQIDCYGVKLNALYKVIKGATYKSKLPYNKKINIRALLLEPDSPGVHARSCIEKNTRVIKDVSLMNEVYQSLLKEYDNHENHNLKVKTFNFTPAFYIIRVNELMLVGTYLAESGYDNLCLHLGRNDGAVFNQFERFFECIWNENSKPLNTA